VDFNRFDLFASFFQKYDCGVSPIFEFARMSEVAAAGAATTA
jgi:hypothetical protein